MILDTPDSVSKELIEADLIQGMDRIVSKYMCTLTSIASSLKYTCTLVARSVVVVNVVCFCIGVNLVVTH